MTTSCHTNEWPCHAQVMSPAKPDFSPSTIATGQRRRLCAALEGLAEKHSVCAASMLSFQVIYTETHTYTRTRESYRHAEVSSVCVHTHIRTHTSAWVALHTCVYAHTNVSHSCVPVRMFERVCALVCSVMHSEQNPYDA